MKLKRFMALIARETKGLLYETGCHTKYNFQLRTTYTTRETTQVVAREVKS